MERTYSQGSSSDDQDTLRIVSEHLQWKKTVPMLYDVFSYERLEGTSFFVQWFPGVEPCAADPAYTLQRLLLGARPEEGDSNYLLVAKVRVPAAILDDDDAEEEESEEDEQNAKRKRKTSPSEAPAAATATSSSEAVPDDSEEICVDSIAQKIFHGSEEVNRARYMPSRPSIVAAKSDTGAVRLFDLEKHPILGPGVSASKEEKEVKYEALLTGTADEGYALSWNVQKNGYLLSSDSVVCCWDVNGNPGPSKRSIAPIFTDSTVHTDVINDVTWFDANVFASVSDDQTLRLWDLRKKSGGTTGLTLPGTIKYDCNLNVVAFQPQSETSLNTASVLVGAADGKILMYELRKLARGSERHVFEAHEDEVFVLNFAPFDDNVFVSAGYDRKCRAFDIGLLDGASRDEGDDEDEALPPGLVFTHAGHTSRVMDVAWNPNENEDWVVASVSEGMNLLHVWKPAAEVLEDVRGGGEGEEEEEEVSVDPRSKRQRTQ